MVYKAYSDSVLPEPPGLGGKLLFLVRKTRHNSDLVSYRGSAVGTNALWDDQLCRDTELLVTGHWQFLVGLGIAQLNLKAEGQNRNAGHAPVQLAVIL